MSLSTQLVRGSLALPMLLLFACLGLLAEAPATAEPVSAAVAAKVALHQLCRVDVSPRSQVIVLAQAPADLGSIAIRWRSPCRA
jgi:hypothetical protein